MQRLPSLLALIILLAIGSSATAQRRGTNRPAAKPTTPIKPGPVPKITASLAGQTGGTVSAGAGKIILDSALVLRDEKGLAYPIRQFTFVYKKKGSYKDEITEKTVVTYEWLTTKMENNEQLDEFWRTNVKQGLQDGEAFYFQKIMADSKKGYSVPVKGLAFEIVK